MSDGIRIRPAGRGDLPRIVELLQQLSMDGARREDIGPPLPQRYHDAFELIERGPDNVVCAAERDGTIVGTFQLTVIQHLRRIGVKVAEVESVVVDEALRGQRIGEAMMRFAIEGARRRGCGHVQLTSNVDRPDAHRFYGRLGFTPGHVGLRYQLDA
ncbi:MAG TPA: GNAT family N-acetyltransferase [Dehalococcoidia bacterium]|nr:GNAT family N-acetyltransferase [Dehalococcoidia bacterium]